jgi:hypothetical protein
VAAGQAVLEPGTEVSATAVEGQPRGPRGRWAVLLRRRHRPITDRSELTPATTEAAGIPDQGGDPASSETTTEASGDHVS